MTAPSIPNLNTLLSSRGGLRGRGRGRGRGGFRGQHEDDPTAKDSTVQRTDDDAADSRMSVVALGYLDDPFAEYFAPDKFARRYPIINRGTYVRTTAIDTLIHKFLSQDPDQPKQIISLGAGSDTRYFRLVTQNPSAKLIYHELDFATNTSSKIAIIKRTPALLHALHTSTPDADSIQFSADGTALSSPSYNIHAVDLRTLAGTTASLRNLSPTTPTLLLSECCLCYVSAATSNSVLRTLGSALAGAPLGVVIYEAVRPHDAFGRTMVANLAARGLAMPGLAAHPSLQSQRRRLADAGFGGGQRVAAVDWLWEAWVAREEKGRVARCEMLDEVEEWRLLAGHYCVAWGWRDAVEGAGGERDGGGGLFGQAWAELEGESGDE